MKSWPILIVILALVGADQLSKYLAEAAMPLNDSVAWIEGFLYITHHHNEGAAWGLFPGATWFFYIVTAIALSVFGYLSMDIDFKRAKFYSVGIVLLIAGTIGNFIDRVRFGYVVDFIDVYIFSYDYPIFNFADSYLTIGVILFAIDLLFFEAKRKAAHAQD
jgi:signal peptidase II